MGARHYAFTDVDLARRVVAASGWGLLVSVPDADADSGDGGPGDGGPLAPIASHVPVLVDGTADGLVVLGHLGRPDDAAHAPRDGRQALLVVEGPSGYVSPGWYGAGPAVEEYARRIAHGAVAFRLRAQRWQGKAKLSQDKPPEVAERVMDALATGEHAASSGERVAHPYGNASLAAMMRAAAEGEL